MAMAAEIGAKVATDIAKEIGTSVVAGVIQQVKNVVKLEGKMNLLNTDFGPVKSLLLQIEQQFQDQQTRLPEAIEVCLTSMTDHLKEGQLLINRANQQRRRCFGCCLMCNPNLFTRITDWETRFRQHFQELVGVFSVSANTTQIVSASAPQTDVLLQPVPESGFVGPAIQSAQMRLQTWLGEAHPQARMIGVFGMGGVGKTSLLKLVYNHCKKVSGIFEVVIWLTISQHYQIEKLQASIAETINLKLEGSSDHDLRKMKLSELLGKKKFLLILDDMWHPIDLINEVGVKFGDHNCSKVLMSSRKRDVIVEMEASEDYSLKIQPLSIEEGWELFRTRAFTNGAVPRDNIETIAKQMASECQGLPLALNAVAAAMRRKKTEVEWRRALTLMTNADPSFRVSHSTIDKELYQPLRWSYNDLTDPDLKICFLYCAVFPEDAQIPVETLVEMWSAEKLVTLMDAGHEYIVVLVDRGLFEYVGADNEGRESVKVHDVLRDLAIYIGQSEENWLFASGQHLQNFPSEDKKGDCKRVSVSHNDIQDLPTDLICSKLLSLVLANNAKIREVPELFLSTAMPLKVLDLSCTSITSLPTSLGQLGQLEFLNLSGCSLLKNLPESTGNLSRLRFLNIEDCPSLESLPESIRELRNLQHLKLGGCYRLMGTPHGISHLTSLNKLFLPIWHSCAISVEDFANLPNLMELKAVVKSEIKESTMTTWMDLRRLEVKCLYDADRDDVVEYMFPLNMENVKKLEDFILQAYEGVSLPNCISQFQNLRTLYLSECSQLRELPVCEIGNGIVGGGFPMLKRLHLYSLEKLESMVGSSVVSSEETMPELEEMYIGNCRSFKRLGTKKLPSLRRISIYSCRELRAMVKSDLMELRAMVKSEIKESTMTTWTDLRRLDVCCFYDADRDDVVEYIFPLNMENAKKLEDFTLSSYWGVSLPNCISQFQNLRTLCLYRCSQLRELPACEIGNGIVGGGFPMLKRLHLYSLEKLESMVGSSVVSSEETMPELEDIKIVSCRSLKRLGTKKLPSLKKLEINDCGSLKKLEINDCGEFEALEIESGDLPMLEELSLNDLDKFESIVGPSGVINDGVMPKLQELYLDTCGLLKRLGLEKLPNLRRISIYSCRELREIEVGSGGFAMLESLYLWGCPNLESIVGPHDVWNEETMPKLQLLKIVKCPLVRRLPRGIEKLSKLHQIIGEGEWWQKLIWEDDNVKNNLSNLFMDYKG